MSPHAETAWLLDLNHHLWHDADAAGRQAAARLVIAERLVQVRERIAADEKPAEDARRDRAPRPVQFR